MKKIIAGCVILYNPKKEDLENLKTYSDKVNVLYVYDNTENKSNEPYFENFTNVQYFSDLENKGLSIRLNQACRLAINDGYEYLLTMDQDSSFDEKNIDLYFDSISNFENKEKVAIFGTEYNINEIKHNYPYFLEIDHVITSGAIMNLNLFDKIGGFDENLFIDCVDIDYCYAALKKNLFVIKFTNIYFKHSLGEPVLRTSNFSFSRKKKCRTIHSNIRIYYMYRNSLFLEKKYGIIFPEYIAALKKRTRKAIKNNIKYSNKIFNIFIFCLRAKRDFINNRMGKLI